MDEWRETVRLRRSYAACWRGGDVAARRLAFAVVVHEAGEHAVWLWNQRREHALANATFLWLLAEAEAVGDARAAAVHRQNVACGAGVPSR